MVTGWEWCGTILLLASLFVFINLSMKVISNTTGRASLPTTLNAMWVRDSPMRKWRLMGPDTAIFLSETLWTYGMSRLMDIAQATLVRTVNCYAVRESTNVKDINKSSHTRRVQSAWNGDLVKFFLKKRNFDCHREWGDILIRVFLLFRCLLVLFLGGNPCFFFDYLFGFEMVLSIPLLFLVLICILVLLLILALTSLSVFLLADIRTVAAVGRLLHARATTPADSVIGFLTGCDYCVAKLLTEDQSWANTLSGRLNTKGMNPDRGVEHISSWAIHYKNCFSKFLRIFEARLRWRVMIGWLYSLPPVLFSHLRLGLVILVTGFDKLCVPLRGPRLETTWFQLL